MPMHFRYSLVPAALVIDGLLHPLLADPPRWPWTAARREWSFWSTSESGSGAVSVLKSASIVNPDLSLWCG